MDSLTIAGSWQDGATSTALPARLRVSGGHARLFCADAPGGTFGEDALFSVPLESLKISPRLGRTPRYLSFLDRDGQFESSDHERLDQLDRSIGSRGYGLIHRLEQHLLMVVVATLVVVGVIGAYFLWGIPAGSKVLAHRLPGDLLNRASRETLEIMQKHYLEETQLSEERRAEIKDSIRTLLPDYPLENLHFYHGGDMGANAFALPDGTIIFTDELVALAESEDELLSVFGHELGHVHHRHSLRQTIQGSAISLSIALISGDASALGDVVLTAPVVFAQMSYSRDFELESDAYAIRFLREHDRDTGAFVSMLRKIHGSHNPCDDGEDCEEIPEKGLTDYLSTHPHLQERIRNAAEA